MSFRSWLNSLRYIQLTLLSTEFCANFGVYRPKMEGKSQKIEKLF